MHHDPQHHHYELGIPTEGIVLEQQAMASRGMVYPFRSLLTLNSLNLKVVIGVTASKSALSSPKRVVDPSELLDDIINCSMVSESRRIRQRGLQWTQC